MSEIEMEIYAQAVRNATLYAHRLQQKADAAREELNVMINKMERIYARHNTHQTWPVLAR